MDTPTALVIEVTDLHVRVRVDAAFACARCAAGRGCGAGLLAGRQRIREFELAPPPGRRLRVGERVELSLLPARLLQASFLAYGLPLVALLLVPLSANWLWGPFPDPVLALYALAALAGAVLAGRRLLARDRCLGRLVPSIGSVREHAQP